MRNSKDLQFLLGVWLVFLPHCTGEASLSNPENLSDWHRSPWRVSQNPHDRWWGQCTSPHAAHLPRNRDNFYEKRIKRLNKALESFNDLVSQPTAHLLSPVKISLLATSILFHASANFNWSTLLSLLTEKIHQVKVPNRLLHWLVLFPLTPLGLDRDGQWI